MKIKLLSSILVGLLFTGCSNNSALNQVDYDEVVSLEIGFELSPKNPIKSLNTPHTVTILKNDGSKDELHYKPRLDIDEVIEACPLELTYGDLTNTASMPSKLLGFKEYQIKNPEKLNTLKTCVHRYLNTSAVGADEAMYVYGDDRITANLDYSPLKNTLAEANKDKKLTYNEVQKIYQKLDEALALNADNELNALREKSIQSTNP